MVHRGDGRRRPGAQISRVEKFLFLFCGVVPREKSVRTAVGGEAFSASKNRQLKDHTVPGKNVIYGTGTDLNINAEADDGGAVNAPTAATGIDTDTDAVSRAEGGSLTPTSPMPTLVGTPPFPTDCHESPPVSALASAQPALVPIVPTPAAGEPEKRQGSQIGTATELGILL